MSRKSSIITLPPSLMASVALLFLCILGAAWVGEEFKQLDHENAEARDAYIDKRTESLFTAVDNVVSFIEFNREQTKKRVRSSIRERVNEAHAIATHVVETFGANKDPATIRSLVREALRPIRFGGGRGYFFAFDLNGVEHLFADRPELEGTNMLGMRGARGEYVVRDMLKLVRAKGEGFYSYFWTKPGEPRDRHFEKVAYVRLIEPLGWVVGTGEYVADVQADIQREVLDRISRMTVLGKEYVFAGQWDGVSLAGPAKGRNMIDVTDIHGVKIVQELIKKAKAGRGVVEYVLPTFGSDQPSAKLSVVAGIPDWEWYVGVGTSVDEIEAQLARQEDFFRKRLNHKLLVVVALVLAGSIATFLVASWLSHRTQVSFDAFLTFFEQSGDDTTAIDLDKLAFTEFETIADAANRMVARQTAELRAAMVDADVANQAKSEFLAKMSHELRTPLNAIIGFSDAVLRNIHGPIENDKQREYLENIHHSGHHLLSLINDILDLSKIEAGKMKLQPQAVDLEAFIADVAALAAPLVEPSGNRLAVEISANIGGMAVDVMRLRQILLNLIGNAGKFTERGAVNLRASRQNVGGSDKIVFVVEDTGIGIAADRLPTLFDEFVQAGESAIARPHEGTGLGLAITKGLTEIMGGSVSVDSTLGEGSTFIVTLPADSSSA